MSIVLGRSTISLKTIMNIDFSSKSESVGTSEARAINIESVDINFSSIKAVVNIDCLNLYTQYKDSDNLLSAKLFYIDDSRNIKETVELSISEVVINKNNLEIYFINTVKNNPISEIRFNSKQLAVTINKDIKEKIKSLFPLTNKAFEAGFMHYANRLGGAETHFFLAYQIFNWFKGKESYRCCAAVVMGFKACEVNAYRKEAFSSIKEAIILTSKIPTASHPRLCGQHLLASLQCSLYHLLITDMDIKNLTNNISEIIKISTSFDGYETLAFPLTKTLLFYAMIAYLSEQRKVSMILMTSCFFVHKLAIKEVGLNALGFTELQESHKCASVALRLREKFKRNHDYEFSRDDFEEAIDSTIRFW